MTEGAIDKLVRLADKRMSRGEDAAAAQAVNDAIKLLQKGINESPALRPRMVELNRLRRVLEYLNSRVS